MLDWKELTEMQRAAYALGILGGLRPGEIFGLRWQDVRFDTHQIEIRRSWNRAVKTRNSRRDTPMLPKLEEVLRAYRELQRTTRISGLVFPAPDDESLGTPNMKVHKRGYTAGWADKRERRTKQGKRTLVTVEGVRSRKGIRSEVAFRHFRHSCAHGLLQGWWGVELTLHEVSKWLGHSSTRVTEEKYAKWEKDSLQNRVTAQLYGVQPTAAKRV